MSGDTETWDKNGYLAGDFVVKVGGDFRFRGTVVGVFWKQNGRIRYVVENEDGMCLIFSKAQLVRVDYANSVPELTSET